MGEPLDTDAWECQLDRALMNAAAVLSEAGTPTCIEEACGLANTWLNVADSWTRRQDNELNYAKWASGLDIPSGAEV